MKTYDVSWRGRRLAVEALVDGSRVRIFSVREVQPHGYEQVRTGDALVDARAAKACNLARSGQTYHDGETPQREGDEVTALSAWSEADRLSLARLVQIASELTDGVVLDPEANRDPR